VVQGRVVRYRLTDVSEEHIASIFTVEYIQQDIGVKAGGKP
jgi:hypothetical protein